MSVLQYREWLTGIGQPLVDELEDLVTGMKTGFRRLLDQNGKFRLRHPQWDDLRMPAIGINPPGLATDPTLNTSDGRWEFTASDTCLLALQAQMPHGWVEGTALEPHIHWSPANANSGNVWWQLDYKIASVNGVFPSTWTTVSGLYPSGGITDQHLIADFSAWDMTGHKLSCILLIKLSRQGGEALDTYNGVARLNYFDIHYQLNSLGSNQEYIK